MQRSSFFFLLFFLVALISVPAGALAPPGAVQNTSPVASVPTAMPVHPAATHAAALPTAFTPGQPAAGLGPWLYIGIVVILIAIAGFVYVYVFR